MITNALQVTATYLGDPWQQKHSAVAVILFYKAITTKRVEINQHLLGKLFAYSIK